MQEEIKHINAIYRVMNWERVRAVLEVETWTTKIINMSRI